MLELRQVERRPRRLEARPLLGHRHDLLQIQKPSRSRDGSRRGTTRVGGLRLPLIRQRPSTPVLLITERRPPSASTRLSPFLRRLRSGWPLERQCLSVYELTRRRPRLARFVRTDVLPSPSTWNPRLGGALLLTDAQRDYHKQYRREHAERIRAYLREWRQRNPRKLREHHERARFRRSGPRRPRPPIPTDPALLGWSAGIIDGEGSIQINRFHPRHDRSRFNYSLGVQVGATDPLMIERLHALWGGTAREFKKRTRTGRLVYGWCVRSLRAEEVLRAVRPYLVTKAAQADLAFEFRSNALRKPELGALYRDNLRKMRAPPPT